jgi:tetratricopeptide (TPR) repeat protein
MEMLAGDLGAAEREMRAALAIHEDIGAMRYAAMVRAHLAHVLLAQGRHDDAVAMIDSSLALGAGSGERFEVYWRTARAKALVHTQDRAAEAVRLDREAIEIVARTDRLNLHAEALAMLGDVLAASGDRAAAIAALDDARRLYERKGNPLLAERTREASARLVEGAETAS